MILIRAILELAAILSLGAGMSMFVASVWVKRWGAACVSFIGTLLIAAILLFSFSGHERGEEWNGGYFWGSLVVLALFASLMIYCARPVRKATGAPQYPEVQLLQDPRDRPGRDS